MKWKRITSLLLAGVMMATTAISGSGNIYAANGQEAGQGGLPAQGQEVGQSDFQTQDFVQYVNPLIGTNNFKGNSEWAGTAPLVTSPFGMTNFTPQTRANRIGDISYMYRDTKFKGFFATHQPAIWMGDYGYVNVAPQIGDSVPDENGRALTFSHDDEVSTPYYYKVTAGKEEGKPITSEMTATERCAIYRFTYPSSSEAKLFVEAARDRAKGNITVDIENGEIYGWNNDNMSSHLNNNPPQNLKGYFVVQFSKPVSGEGVYQDYQLQESAVTAEGQKTGAYLTFSTEQDEAIEVKIGTSFISVEQARKNIQQEIGAKSFDTVKNELKDAWNEKMNVIQIEGATEAEKKIFYTAMYHALLYPRTFYEEVDGKNIYFSPYDDQYHEGKSYTDFSLWDTFRAQNSFLTLVAPERVNDMIQSLLQNYQEGGYMPKWPNPGYTNIMIGTHADSIVAEAINKGFDGFDYDLAYEAVLKDAMVPQEGDGTIKWSDRQTNVPYEARGGLSAYKALGYIPNGYVSENVSRTVEFAYDDWCVAQVAKAVGEDAQAKYFINRSLNYKNAINPETGYAMGRDVDGNWTTSGGEGFTEGDRRKYTWFALHDPQGLLDYMTENQGENFYNQELEKAFGGQGGSKWIEHQNEPCHHYGYMFNFSGRPDLAQKYVRQTLLESYTDDTNGELGNDDCGQMSAWYVFSAMGFYPVNPASGEYIIGSPIFDKVTINNPQTGKQFVITAENNDDEDNQNCYIQSAQLNGKALDIPVLTYSQITAGGQAGFVMGDQPSAWASDYKKDAIEYDASAEAPEDNTTPPFFGNSEVRRVTGINHAKDAKVSATNFRNPGGDIDDPAKSLIDGNYDLGYISQDMSSSQLAATPYYLTMEWDTPKAKLTSMKLWSNYRGMQEPTKIDIQVKGEGQEWETVKEDYSPEWKDESGGDRRCSARIELEDQENVSALRIWIKEANLGWGHIAVREWEVFEDFPTQIDYENPSDFIATIRYNGNKLEKVLFNGEELAQGTDYEFSDEKQTQIKIPGSTLVRDGACARARLEFVFSQGASYVEEFVVWKDWSANLESLVKIAKKADESLYTQNSLKGLQTVIEEAESLLLAGADEAKLEEMSQKLEEAIDSLVALIDGYGKVEFEEANSRTSEKNPDTGADLTVESAEGGKIIANTFDGAWFLYDGIKFGDVAPNKVEVRYTGGNNCYRDAKVEVRLDGPEGELLATVEISHDQNWGPYRSATALIDDAAGEKMKGTHTICIVLKGTRENGRNYVGNFDWITFDADIRNGLQDAVNTAEKTLKGAVVGFRPGNYPQEAKDALGQAIQKAKAELEREGITKEECKEAERALREMIQAFKDSAFTEEEAEAARKVVEAIDSLGEITLDSAEAIKAARNAYEALSERVKPMVPNYGTLAAAEEAWNILNHQAEIKAAAQSVDEAIKGLGDITLESKAAIEAARNAYEALEAEAKALVTEYSALQLAEAQLSVLEGEQKAEELRQQMNQAAANAIIEVIDAIGDVTLESEAAIKAAKAGYNSLTQEQQGLVVNYSVLEKAESDLESMKKEQQDKKDKEGQLKAQAKPVEDAIAKLENVDLKNKADVEAARKAYEALPAEVKAVVGNLSVLVIAEKDIAELEVQEQLKKAQKELEANKKKLNEKLAIAKKKLQIAKTKAKITKVQAKKKAVKITWKKISGAKGYVISYKVGSKGKWKTAKTITSVKKTSYTHKKLKSGKTYYYRVRAYWKVDGKKVYNDYSAARKVKVK